MCGHGLGSGTPLITPKTPPFVLGWICSLVSSLGFALAPGFCSDTRTVLSTLNPLLRLLWPRDCGFPDKTRNDGAGLLELPGSLRGAGPGLLRGQMSPHAAFLLQLQTRTSSFTSHFPSHVSRHQSRAVRASGCSSPPRDRWGNAQRWWFELWSFVSGGSVATWVLRVPPARVCSSLCPLPVCWGKHFVIPAGLRVFPRRFQQCAPRKSRVLARAGLVQREDSPLGAGC